MFTHTAPEAIEDASDYLPVPHRGAGTMAGTSGQPPTGRRGVARSAPESAVRLALSVPEVARVLGISRALAYELVAQGEIPCVRLGKRIVVPMTALAALLDAAIS